jgi:hypothetical protein
MQGKQALGLKATPLRRRSRKLKPNGVRELSVYAITPACDELERIKQIKDFLADSRWEELPPAILQSLRGIEGLRRLAAAITIEMIDRGGHIDGIPAPT